MENLDDLASCGNLLVIHASRVGDRVDREPEHSPDADALGWNPRVDLESLVRMMVDADLKRARRDKLLRENDFDIARNLDD